MYDMDTLDFIPLLKNAEICFCHLYKNLFIYAFTYVRICFLMMKVYYDNRNSYIINLFCFILYVRQ